MKRKSNYPEKHCFPWWRFIGCIFGFHKRHEITNQSGKFLAWSSCEICGDEYTFTGFYDN